MDPFRAPEKNQNSLNPPGQQEKDAAKRETRKVGQTLLQLEHSGRPPGACGQSCATSSLHTHTHTFLLASYSDTICVCEMEASVCFVLSRCVAPGNYWTSEDHDRSVDNQKCFLQ